MYCLESRHLCSENREERGGVEREREAHRWTDGGKAG